MSTVAETHSAAGSMAGYLFQLDLALLWLARSPIGTSVGVETIDDVAKVDPAGWIEIGQSKLSYTRNLYADGNINLWKTLSIWVGLTTDDEVDLEKTQFFLISNFEANSGFVAKLKKAETDADFHQAVRTLRTLAAQASTENAKYAAIVSNCKENLLCEILQKIKVTDSIPSHPQQQLSHFAAAMNLPANIVEEVVRGMRGWILERTETAFAERQPAWVQKDCFSEELARLIAIHHDNRLVLRTANEIEVKPEDQASAKTAIFVEQMRWIDTPSDEMLDAIIDFLRSKEERTRLADKNDISKREFAAFEGRLVDRWKGIHRTAADCNPDAQRAGRVALRSTLDHREDLAGQHTSEYYLTRGTYHYLANQPTASVGWHPEFRTMLCPTDKQL